MENASYSFSTQPYPPRQRFEVWREEVNALFDVRIGESESIAFNYRLTTCYLGALLMGCGVWEGTQKPVHYDVKRSAQMIRRDGLDHYYICLGLSHSINGLAGQAPLVACHSQIYVLDLAQQLDCVITAGDTIILTVPRDLLAAQLGNKDIHGLVLRGGLSDLLADHMRALRARSASFKSDETLYIQQATLAMVAAAITPSIPNLKSAETEIDRSLFNRARNLIEQHLLNPDLAPAFICRHMGISRAGLYRLFEQESGVAAYIQRRRLDKIRAILQGDSNVQHRTSGLAFQFGFKSESHFSRSFKKAFGYSPKEARDCLIASEHFGSAGQTSVHTGFSLRTVLDQMTSG
ncbi:helix-turn-helix domain-containing protein [Pseudomonas sp. ChxA]|uniref:AraC family transcriptional regulator n=1 Tax=Pseudomonas fluorescens TaxID=294 RepID=A0A2T0HPR5_PSEFL|nr:MULTISPECIES: helix-turn-helix domain-containing protein [Pseudomonas]MDL2185881.1 helix-turn-helix domain-containing protein [Pseudomonas sp. ChxA]MQT39520.1 helix-turn-helix domain-containing protein [Pseudomonas sp. FSL R10-0765]PRW85085.1 AraC family transcriptional regulator [Pseudomonas fluorescens]TPV55872.1 helix-turn-helix domain-containing protein [Pseudomonas fluorescens]